MSEEKNAIMMVFTTNNTRCEITVWDVNDAIALMVAHSEQHATFVTGNHPFNAEGSPPYDAKSSPSLKKLDKLKKKKTRKPKKPETKAESFKLLRTVEKKKKKAAVKKKVTSPAVVEKPLTIEIANATGTVFKRNKEGMKSLAEKVFTLLKHKGEATPTIIMDELDLTSKQVSNAVYGLRQRKLVYSEEQGVYKPVLALY